MPRLEFSHVHSYAARTEGISLPVVLRSGGERVDLIAFVDTGASNCLFGRTHGEVLNLDIEAGDAKAFSTATGPLDAFGHTTSSADRTDLNLPAGRARGATFDACASIAAL
jgi:hypothetical protein